MLTSFCLYWPDPRLTMKAKPLDMDSVTSKGESMSMYTASFIMASSMVMDELKSKGVSGPCLNFPYQIMCIAEDSKESSMGLTKFPSRFTGDPAMYFRVIANPEIISSSSKKVEAPEGCTCCPGLDDLQITRPASVEVEFDALEFHVQWEDNEDSKKMSISKANITTTREERIFSGDTARFVQHEMDHLNGIMITEQMGPLSRRNYRAQALNLSKIRDLFGKPWSDPRELLEAFKADSQDTESLIEVLKEIEKLVEKKVNPAHIIANAHKGGIARLMEAYPGLMKSLEGKDIDLLLYALTKIFTTHAYEDVKRFTDIIRISAIKAMREERHKNELPK